MDQDVLTAKQNVYKNVLDENSQRYVVLGYFPFVFLDNEYRI